MNNDKLLYLKALCPEKDSQKKIAKEITEAIEFFKASGVNEFEIKPEVKTKDPITDILEGRQFILKHTEEFLNYAIDYSMVDKINDIVGQME